MRVFSFPVRGSKEGAGSEKQRKTTTRREPKRKQGKQWALVHGVIASWNRESDQPAAEAVFTNTPSQQAWTKNKGGAKGYQKTSRRKAKASQVT